MGDACSKCGGRGEVPLVKGAYDRWVRCNLCKGSGGRKPAR
jgi:DnaJ-class molecular chaperone